ncbi:hypothetical protein KFL_009490030 [Klebsormidium nitens]|uniref:Uncharacterized protein n=1 Tax=Klebsormidium nitens TaxID=105231 RepID=A0A1Y1ISH2_KLENI|nr:hypothetical protein KFL_009490030 [Klebsormidium nitens]|eukprot:GAQ92221.1 hypothetical protein KFL_009490030 [Klebsormidium nitens]
MPADATRLLRRRTQNLAAHWAPAEHQASFSTSTGSRRQTQHSTAGQARGKRHISGREQVDSKRLGSDEPAHICGEPRVASAAGIIAAATREYDHDVHIAQILR